MIAGYDIIFLLILGIGVIEVEIFSLRPSFEQSDQFLKDRKGLEVLLFLIILDSLLVLIIDVGALLNLGIRFRTRADQINQTKGDKSAKEMFRSDFHGPAKIIVIPQTSKGLIYYSGLSYRAHGTKR